MIKNKVYRYFFIEFFKLFILINLSLSLLIWFTQAARLLELVTDYGNPISVYAKYLLLIYPKILDNTFLLSFIVSLFFLYSKFETDNELQIYWLSGISKLKIHQLCIYIGIVSLIINLSFSIFIAPWSSYQGRMILGNSKFTLINAVVKEKNFNSPLKGLTVYVEKNNKQGNIEGIFIYEKTRTITAEKGEVLSDENGSYLKLINGTTQEKTGSKVNFLKFQNTIFDFSKYQIKNTTAPKYSERNLYWLINNLDNKKISKARKIELREEINSRIIKPFMILILTSLISFLIFANNENINSKKFKFYIYCFSVLGIILNEILVRLSGESIIYTYVYCGILISLFIIINLIFIKFYKNEKIYT